MPHVRIISAGGSEQRRLVDDALAELRELGHSDVRHQDGGDWGALLTENAGGGLFDEKSLVVVEGAEKMEMMPERFAPLLEPAGAPAVILLVHSTKQGAEDDDDQRSRRPIPVPKSLIDRCVVVKGAAAPPPWSKEREQAAVDAARASGADMDQDAALMLKDLYQDMEELRAESSKLAICCAASGRPSVTREDVAELCMSDGARDLMTLLDGLCEGDVRGVRAAIARMASKDDLIPLLAAVHNRMRAAYYMAEYGAASSHFIKAIGASPYAARLAERAAKRYRREDVSNFVSSVIQISINERSGRGAGWHDFEMLVLELFAGAR